MAISFNHICKLSRGLTNFLRPSCLHNASPGLKLLIYYFVSYKEIENTLVSVNRELWVKLYENPQLILLLTQDRWNN